MFFQSFDVSYLQFPRVLLSQDVSIYVAMNGNNGDKGFCTSHRRSSGNIGTDCGYMIVDIDGPSKGKNAWGIDYFEFAITKNDGIVPKVSFEGPYSMSLQTCFSSAKCADWVLKKGNLDYLKVDSSGNCTDGTPLTWERGSCK